MVKTKRTTFNEQIALLVRSEARSGKVKVIDLQQRFNLSESVVYKMLNLKGKYSRIGGEPIKVKSINAMKMRGAVLLLKRLGVEMKDIKVYVGKSDSWLYHVALHYADKASKPNVPLKVLRAFHDSNENERKPGYYWVRQLNDDECWVTPLKDETKGFLVEMNVLVRNVETMPGRDYE